MGVKCPICDGQEIEDISHEIAGNKYFDPKTQRFYHCKGKLLHNYKKYIGMWYGKKQYKTTVEIIDCETEFLIIIIEKKAMKIEEEFENKINQGVEIQNGP